jgi:dTDP-4-dehydrorhamnose reductase
MSDSVKMLKVLVTVAGGQLGQELVKLNMPGIEFIGVDRYTMDITDPEMRARVIGLAAPNVIIHSAAYTAVDRLESEVERAWLVNA